MNYSRRQLEALGEPFGESATRLKLGGRVYGSGGGGGGSAPAPDKTTQTMELPEWARPYAQSTLAKGAALTDINQNPYQQYGGNRIAGFSPMQMQSFQGAANMDAGPRGFQENVGGYMSPYMQNVVDVEKRGAIRDYQIGNTMQQAQATQAGAFGGGREAIQRAERERGLMGTLGGIQAKGSQAAYDQAANQFRQGISQGMDVSKLQNTYGGQMQQQAQRPLDMAYQDFQNQQNYPYKQLGFMSDLVRGMPLGQKSTSSVYEAPGSTMGQLAGLGMGAYGLSRMMAADGGLMKSYADGGDVKTYAGDKGSVTSQDNKNSIVGGMYSIEELQTAKEAALARRDVDTANAIDERIAALNAIQAQNASIDRGLGSAFDQIPQDRQEEIMSGANGGIVAFADGGGAENKKQGSVIGKEIMEGLSSFFSNFNPSTAGYTEEVIQTPEAAVEKSKVLQQAARETPAPKVASPSAPAPAPAAPVKQAEAPTPKPTAKVKEITIPKVAAGLQAAAASKGITGDDLLAEAKKAKEFFAEESKEELKGIQDLVEKQAGKSKEIKSRALDKAITEYGFNLAERASRKGKESQGQGFAGLIGSAAAASPTLAASAAESQRLVDAAEENQSKLQMEFTKYKVALSKNDTNAAMAHASNVRQLQMAQQQIELKRQEIANTSVYQQGSLGLQGAALQQKTDQFGQIMGARTEAAKAQNAVAGARLAEVRRKATVDFDSSNRTLRNQLIEQHGPLQGEYLYKQQRTQYIGDVLQQQRDQQANTADAVNGASGSTKSVFDLLDMS
jgi:hypothetical protein